MKLLFTVLLLASLASCQSTTLQFREVLTDCIALLTQFQTKFPIMKTSIKDLNKGIMNLYNMEITDSDLAGTEQLIVDVQSYLHSIPPNAVQNVKADKLMQLLSALGALRKIFPSSPSAFNASLQKNGGIAGVARAAQGPIMQVVQALS